MWRLSTLRMGSHCPASVSRCIWTPFERALVVDDVVHHIGHGRRFCLTLSLRERDR